MDKQTEKMIKDYERMEIEASLFAQNCRKARMALLASVEGPAPSGGKSKKLSEATIINITNRRVQHFMKKANRKTIQ